MGMCGFSYCMYVNVVLNYELNFTDQYNRIVSLDSRLNFLSNHNSITIFLHGIKA